MSVASDTIRKEWKISDAKRDAGLTTPDDVERYDDIQYGPDSEWNVLDVYRPKGKEEKLPVIVNVHGGGWVYGDKELYQFYGMALAQRGFAVVNFTYHLAPEYKYPMSFEDMNRVICWMYDNAGKYRLDMEHVFMVGDSAGGHMAALYTDICTNPEYAKHYDFTVPNGFRAKALGLNCGVYTPLGREAEMSSESHDKEFMQDLLPNGGTPEEAELVDVTKHVTPDFPPVFLMTAVGDFCRQQASFMREALERNRVPYFFKIYGSEERPLYHVFHVTIQEEEGRRCNDEECKFFRCFIND